MNFAQLLITQRDDSIIMLPFGVILILSEFYNEISARELVYCGYQVVKEFLR